MAETELKNQESIRLAKEATTKAIEIKNSADAMIRNLPSRRIFRER